VRKLSFRTATGNSHRAAAISPQNATGEYTSMTLVETARHARQANRRAMRVALPGALTAAAVVIGAIPLLIQTVLAMQGYFAQDDFLITFRAAHSSPVSPAFLFQDYNGHISPGMFLYAWLVTAVAPLNFPVAMVPLLLMRVATVVLFWRLLVRVFGRRWALLVPLAVLSGCVVVLLPTLWWAYAIELVPCQLALVCALHALVSYLRGGGAKPATLTVVWVVVGLAFYEKALLFAVVLVAATALLTPGRLPLLTALRAHWRLWLAHAAVGAAFLILHSAVSTTTVHAGTVEHGAVLDLTRRVVVDTFLVGVFGGPWRPVNSVGVTPSSAILVAVSLATVVIVVAGLLVRRARAGLAWTMLAGYLLLDVAMVALVRLGQIGPLIGADPRYTADAILVGALLGAFAFLRPDDAPAPSKWERSLATGLAVLVLATSTVTLLRLSPEMRFTEARSYVDTASAAVAADPDLVVYDANVPDDIMIGWFGDDGRASRVLGLLPHPPRFDGQSEHLQLLDANGKPHPVTTLQYAVPAAAKGPAKDCGWPITATPTAIQLQSPVVNRRVVMLDYYTAGRSEGLLVTGTTRTKVQFHEGLHRLYVVVDAEYDRIELSGLGTPVCLAGLLVGIP
jgi:hypothetical protein